MSHPQLRQLLLMETYLNQQPVLPENSSSSSSHKPQIDTFFSHSNQISTSSAAGSSPTTLASSYNSHDSFASKLVKPNPSSYCQQLCNIIVHHAIPSCFKLSSSRSGRFKLQHKSTFFMASQVDDSPAMSLASDNVRRNKISGQQKRAALEREVPMLQKMLKHEEKLPEILEGIHKKQHGTGITIPSFLPPKAKELLAEIAMVEDEIARLEGQIGQLQLGLKCEQESIRKTKTKPWQLAGTLSNLQDNSVSASKQGPADKGMQGKMGFETKELHFISKAIKGDYNYNDFTLHEKMGSSGLFPSQKENHSLRRLNVETDFEVKEGS